MAAEHAHAVADIVVKPVEPDDDPRRAHLFSGARQVTPVPARVAHRLV